MVSRNKKIVLLFSLFIFCGCSAGYIMRAAYEQAKIMSRREKIEDVINDPATGDLERKKLILVKEARVYAQQIGLNPKNTFKKYAKLDHDVLSWILLGSKPDAFELYTWWFPIVGTVPYKGFFELADAKDYSEKLTKKGYETSVRESSAFSTLGWFDDPILSSTLKNDEISIVNTVIHESVHTSLWLQSHVDFNESLANFIGTIGACDFFQARYNACETADKACLEENDKYYKTCMQDASLQFEFAGVIIGLYTDLDKLYKSGANSAEKVAGREVIFDNYIKPLRLKYPRMKALQKINNAEIMQFKLYMSGYDKFNDLYVRNNKSLSATIQILLSKAAELKKAENPFEELSNL